MTEKRFVYYEHKGADYILDTPNKSLDFIEMLGDCLEAEEIVDLLNELHDENGQLRKENDMLSCELSVSANKEISRNCRIAELEEENEQLKQQKEVWKQICCTNSNFNSILLHELDIAQEQGFKVSNPFKQFLEDREDVE